MRARSVFPSGVAISLQHCGLVSQHCRRVILPAKKSGGYADPFRGVGITAVARDAMANEPNDEVCSHISDVTVLLTHSLRRLP